MKEFLNFLLTLFLDYPQDVNVNEKNMGDNVFLYTITTHKEDTGKVIGREGKIIQAIRNVTKILAIKEGKQIRIEIASAI
jgi:predicted RNA-binding protein YlqC (UPF0109 family)